MIVRYVQNRASTMCTVVSNDLPFQSFEEYPKNWIINLAPQKMPMPRDIRLPNVVSISSLAEVMHSNPTKNTANAIKNECTYMICRFIKVNLSKSCFQLKYFGK
jgi:hypothetical protein